MLNTEDTVPVVHASRKNVAYAFIHESSSPSLVNNIVRTKTTLALMSPDSVTCPAAIKRCRINLQFLAMFSPVCRADAVIPQCLLP